MDSTQVVYIGLVVLSMAGMIFSYLAGYYRGQRSKSILQEKRIHKLEEEVQRFQETS